MKKIKNDIKTQKFEKVYLLYGREDYAIKQYEKKIISACVSPEFELMNINRFEGDKCNMEDIALALQTPAFMSDKRVTVIENSGFFKLAKTEETVIRLTELLKNMTDENIVIFVEPDTEKKGVYSSNVDKKRVLYKLVNTLGYVSEINRFSEKELMDIVLKKTKNNISNSDCAYFVQVVGNELAVVQGETDKLLNYCNGRTITKADIDAVCTKSADFTVFELVDAICKKETGKALEIYNRLLFTKQSTVFGILALTASKIRYLLRCRDLAARGRSLSEIAERVKQREYFLARDLETAKRYGIDKLRRALEALKECDTDIKTGKMEPELCFELFIIKYSM